VTAVEPHPLNVGFTWEPPSPPFGRLSEEQAASFDEDGYFVVPHALDRAAVAALEAEIDPFERELEDALRRAEGGRVFIARAGEITFTTHLVARSPHLRRFVSGEPMLGICADLLGPDVRLYWDQAVYKKPGTAAPFPWHQDNGYAFVDPQQYLTFWIALTDATEENGCPWVVPGLHRLGTLAHRATETGLVCGDGGRPARPVPVAAGGIVVLSSLTPHCTGPNRTDRVRKAYIVQYAPEGAAVIRTGPARKLEREPADDPDRQFPVLAGGRPATTDELER